MYNMDFIFNIKVLNWRRNYDNGFKNKDTSMINVGRLCSFIIVTLIQTSDTRVYTAENKLFSLLQWNWYYM